MDRTCLAKVVYPTIYIAPRWWSEQFFSSLARLTDKYYPLFLGISWSRTQGPTQVSSPSTPARLEPTQAIILRSTLVLPFVPWTAASHGPGSAQPFQFGAVVCSACGDPGHNVKTFPVMKRGPRDSPRTPGNEEKVAMLRDLSKKFSPGPGVLPLPLGANGASASASGVEEKASTAVPAQHEQTRSQADGDDDIKTMMKKMIGIIGSLLNYMQTVKSAVEAAGQKANKAVSIAESTAEKLAEVQKSTMDRMEVQSLINDSGSNAVEQKIKDMQVDVGKMRPDQDTLVMGGVNGVLVRGGRTMDPEDC